MANRYEDGFKKNGRWYYKGKSGKAIPIKTSASRYREMAKNPNQRPSVPTKYLPANLRRQREMNIRLDTPVGAGSTVTNRDVAREAEADAGVRYGQAEQDLGYQIQRQQARQSMIPSYMDQYRQQLAQAQQRTQAAYAQAQQQMTGLGQALGQSAPGVQAANDPQAAVVAQQAAAVRQAGAGSLAGLAATQGANTNARYESDIANVGLRLVEELAREAGKGRELGEKRSQLLREKGEYTSSQRAKLTEGYRKAGLENLVFASDVKAAEDKATATAAAAKTKAAADQRKEDNKVNQWGYTNAEWRRKSEAERQAIIRKQKRAGMKSGSKGSSGSRGGSSGGSKPGKPGKEPASSLNVRRNLLDRLSTIRSLSRQEGIKDRESFKRATYRSRSGWYTPGVEQLKTAAALDLAYGNRIGSGTLKGLRDRGVYVTSTGEYWGGGNRNAS